MRGERLRASETWTQALGTTAKSYAKSFWYVARVGVPLMVLAAVLGALAVVDDPAAGIAGSGDAGRDCVGGTGGDVFAGADGV